MSALLVALLIATALAVPVLRATPASATLAPHDGEVTYKEYWIPHKQFTGGCDSEPRAAGYWYSEPSPCPQSMQLVIPDNVSGALRAEVYLDLWRNRDVPKVRFQINGGKTYAPEVGSDWSRTPWVGDVELTDLVQGTNTLRFTAFFPIHIHDVAVRVYYDAAHPLVAGAGSDVTPPTGALTQIVAANGTFNPAAGGTLDLDSNRVTFRATANDDKGVAHVDFIGRYEGYDIDGDGITNEWQAIGRNNYFKGGLEARPQGGLIDHLGSDAVAPYEVNADFTPVPNQSGVAFKIRVVDAAGNVRETAGGASAPFTLTRSRDVEVYRIPDFEDLVLHHDGQFPDLAHRTITLPDDLTGVSSAYLVGNYWNNPFISLNGNTRFRAHEGTEDTWALSVRSVPVNTIGPGINDLVFEYRSPGFGQFVEKPGPMVVLYRDIVNPAPPAVVTQPQSVAVAANMQATFTVEASGSPKPTYQWMRDGVDIPGATGATYVTPRVANEDAGTVYSVRLTNRFGTVTSAGATLSIAPPAPWWNNQWPYRIEVNIGAAGYERVDKPTTVGINFTTHLASIGEPGALDPNTIRVIEVNQAGAVIDDNIQYQFDGTTSYNALTNADGNLVFMMEGTTAPTATRRYHVYFAKTGSGIGAFPQSNQIHVIDNVMDEGQRSFRFETPSGVWTYQKDAGGFSSLDDVNGNDWLSYNATHGAGGSFRGVPNAIFPDGEFHPGATGSRTELLSSGPIHAAIRSTTLDGRFGIRWDIYPTYATAQITRARAEYWFLYEGTPGGQVTPAQDFVVRANGTKTFIGESWAGDLPGEEWLYFADGAINRSVFVAHHDDDNAKEYYQLLDSKMTVFGFGRQLSVPQLRRSGEKFTLGLMDTRDYAAAKKVVANSYRDLRVLSGYVERRTGNKLPGAPLNVTASPQDSGALVRWDDLVEHGGAKVTDYVITPSPSGDPVTVSADTVDSAVEGLSEAMVPGLVNGQEYTFTVAAVNDVGRGPDSLPSDPVKPTPVQGVASDDFNSPSLASHWQIYDPNLLDPEADDYPIARFPEGWEPDPDYAADIVATGTELVIKVPEGRSTDLWTGRPFAPRVTQEVPDSDFQVVLKYETDTTKLFQFQGFIVQQDETNFLRFDTLFATAGGFANGVLKVQAAAIVNGEGRPMVEEIAVTNKVRYLRVTREGDRFTLEYSENGTSWFEAGAFTFDITMTRAGVFAGSHQNVEKDTPEFISRLDYVFNAAAPIDPEDANPDTEPLQIQDLQVQASDTRAKVTWRTDELSTGVVDFGLTDEYELGSVESDELDFDHEVLITGLDPGTDLHAKLTATDVRGMVAESEDRPFTTLGGGSADTIINIWSGENQSFGKTGQPQKWINVLGNVSDVDGIERAWYTLNDDPTEHELTIGDDPRRLAKVGDINVELAFTSMTRGENLVTVYAEDAYGNIASKEVNLDVELARTWPLPYTLDWEDAPSVEAAAQIVDGKWTKDGTAGIKPVELGYDRLVAIGDLGWTDYEVTVPITLRSIDPDGYEFPSAGPAVGMILRWPGHYDWDGSQPRYGFSPLGALGWYRFHTNGVNQLVMSDGAGQNAVVSSGFTMQFNRTYMFKMAVQTEIGQGSANGHRYTLSVWEAGQPEQTAVTLTNLQPLSGVPSGSAVLVAHHVDATFGDVEVKRINPAINPTITPAPGSYTSGQTVTITTPAQNSTIHYTLDGTVPTTNSPVYTGPFKVNADIEVRAMAVRQGLDQSAVSTSSFVIRKGTPIVSDDFSGGKVNTDIWTEVDPKGDVGVRTTATDLLMDIPGGGTHDLFDNRLLALRMMQSAPNTNMGVETRIMDTYSGTFTQAGILAHQTFRDFMRFDVYRNGTRRFIFAGSFANGTVKSLLNKEITVTGGDVFMRVTRSGHNWTVFWSDDGVNWVNEGTFFRPMVLTSVGPWAGSHANTGSSPAFVGTFDYFFNMASPIANEDGVVNNVAPVVDAGPNRNVTLPAGASLDGTVTDDGKPTPPAAVTTTWSVVGGPGTVNFANAAAIDTTATFSAPGTYVLRLTANDGQHSAFDTVTVTVKNNASAPQVDAGPAQTVTITQGVSLEGTVTDDGIPAPPALTSTWTLESGPAPVSFANPAAPHTTASFTATGTYLLRLTGNDGLHSAFDLVEVRVVAPRETAGLLALYDFGDAEGDTIGDVSANGVPLDLHIGNVNSVTWTRTSLLVNQDVQIASHEPATKINEPIKASNQLTVEAWIRPAHLNQVGPARIVGLSADSLHRNFTLGQGEGAAGTGAKFQSRLRSSATDLNGLPATITEPVLKAGMQHLVFTRKTDGTVTLYLDGVPVKTATVGGTLANWDANYALVMANEFDGQRPWLGEYELLAFYDRALTPEQVANHAQHGPEIVGGNQPPTVDAGPDQSIELPAPAELQGSVADDRRPSRNGLRQSWSVVSGPGPVVFDDATSPATKATFTVDGTYVLRLNADDGLAAVSDTVTIEVKPEPPNDPPVVSAGPDQEVTVISQAVLDGSVVDDGYPFPGILTIGWTKKSGPGLVTFGDATQVDTTALFSVAGTYVLTLTANDGEDVVSDDVTVKVVPPPRAAGGLVAMYGFDGPGNIVRDISAVGAPLDLTIANPENVTWGDGDLTVNAATMISSTGPASKLNQALVATHEFTVEAWVDPAMLKPPGPGRIATLSKGSDNLNFTLSQGYHPTDNSELWRSKMRSSGSTSTAVAPLANDQLQHVVLTRSNTAKQLKMYINGVLVDTRVSGGNLANWDQTMPLVLGNEPVGGRGWLGTFEYLAFYNRPLSANEVNVNFLAGPETQKPPRVEAGDDQLVEFPGVATLDGTVSDDGEPNPPGALQIHWTKVSGPGTPLFTNPSSPDTTVSVDVPGTYVLRLEAYDGQLASTDTVQVKILNNEAPTVNAGPDQAIELGQPATLQGTVSDDGLPEPPGAVATLWSQVSGPADAVFADPEALQTGVTFPAAGTYVLRLTADDSARDASDTVTVVVKANAAPVVDAGTDSVVDVTQTATLDATVTDDGLPAAPGAFTVAWSKESGPGNVTFANATAQDTTATFDAMGTYVLKLTANDGALTSSDTVTVQVVAPDRITSGLTALYDFEEAGGGVVHDVSGVGAPLDLTVANPARTTWTGGGLRIDQATRIHSAAGARKISEPSRTTGAITIEAWIEPTDLKPAGPGRIVTISDNDVNRNVTVGQGFVKGQATDLYRARVLTTATPGNPLAAIKNTDLQHLVYTINSTDGTARMYLDGQLVESRAGTGVLSNWSLTRPLSLGDEPTGTYAWRGTYHLVAFYSRALSATEIRNNFLAGSGAQEAPTVDAGPDQTVEFPNAANLDGTVADDGLPANPGTVTTTWSKVSGPGTVTFADASVVDTTAQFSVAGTYVLRLSASDGALTTTDDITVEVKENTAPTVDAGADQTVEFPSGATLDGTVADDGLPADPGAVTTTWSLVTGPGQAIFADAGSVDTTVNFTDAGTYVLRLTADDGALSTADEITVVSGQNTAPTVNAGDDGAIAAGEAASLNATVTDDGLPGDPGKVTTTWSKVSGPGTVVFGNAAAVDTTVTFGTAGTYVLQLAATDGALETTDTVTYEVSAAAPVAAPTFTPAGGTFVNQVQVSIATATDGATVRYTTDGSTPTAGSPVYSGPITVTQTSVVKAFATKAGRPDSDVSSGSYTIQVSPRVGNGLLALYTFDEGAGATVADTSGNGTPMNLTVADPTRATWGQGTLTLTAATQVATSGPATKVIAGAKATNAITVEAWVTPALANPANPGRIVAVADHQSARDVVLGQGFWTGGNNRIYETRLWTTSNFNNPLASSTNVATQLTHVVLTRSAAGAQRLYVDGQVVASGNTAGTFGDWSNVFKFVLGNDGNGERPWLGTYHLVAVYNREFGQAEVDKNRGAGPMDGQAAPTVDAGPDQAVEFPSPAALNGVVTDDGKPNPPGVVTTTWSKVSGPGSVAFEDAGAASTSVTFTDPGTYVLRLRADDGEKAASDDVTVVAGANAAPVVDAGPNRTIAVDGVASLDATVADDGLPSPSSLTAAWTKESGPGTATFADATSVDTTVTFDQPGTYSLRLEISDGALTASDTTTVTVTVPSPRVTSGLLSLYTFDEAAGTTVADTSGAGSPMNLAIDSLNNIAWGPGTLTLTGSARIGTVGAATKLIDGLKATDRMTLEAWITPSEGAPTTPGRIATLSSSENSRNVSLSQGFWANGDNTIYETRLWTTAHYNNPVTSGTTKVATKLTHVVLVRDATVARLYVDGVEVGSRAVSGTFDDWNATYSFLLGNEGTGDRGWKGTYHLVAVYDRALSAADVSQNYGVGPLD